MSSVWQYFDLMRVCLFVCVYRRSWFSCWIEPEEPTLGCFCFLFICCFFFLNWSLNERFTAQENPGGFKKKRSRQPLLMSTVHHRKQITNSAASPACPPHMWLERVTVNNDLARGGFFSFFVKPFLSVHAFRFAWRWFRFSQYRPRFSASVKRW